MFGATPRLKTWTRIAHLVLSLFGMLALLFFALTGFVMNHEDWFGLDEAGEQTTMGQLPRELLVDPEPERIIEYLRETYSVEGRASDLDVAADEIVVEFRDPTGSAEAKIHRPEGFLLLETRQYGTLRVMAHLHQGKRTGTVGSWLIDLTAGVLGLAAISGIVLFVSIPRRRRLGMLSLAAGVALFALAWIAVLV